jgi:type II secretory pathway predicted ATPase ExeA
MFESFYGFSRNTFDKHNLMESDAFISNDHREMISRLEYLKDKRGIGVFTARPGLGKTFALRCFAKSLPPNLYRMEYIAMSTVSVMEFYRQLCLKLNLEPAHYKTVMFKAIQDRVFQYFSEKRMPLILAIDEAQELNTSILNDLKILINHAYDSLNCFSLVLVGEPHFNRTLEKNIHEALRQRIIVHYNYEGLSNDEIIKYIEHKFRLAGATPSIIGEGVFNAIINNCNGIPRYIDSLMNEALMIGAQLKKQVLDTEVILGAANNLAL